MFDSAQQATFTLVRMTPESLQSAVDDNLLGELMASDGSWNGVCSACSSDANSEHDSSDVACCSLCNLVYHKCCLTAKDTNLAMMNDTNPTALWACPECWALACKSAAWAPAYAEWALIGSGASFQDWRDDSAGRGEQ